MMSLWDSDKLDFNCFLRISYLKFICILLSISIRSVYAWSYLKSICVIPPTLSLDFICTSLISYRKLIRVFIMSFILNVYVLSLHLHIRDQCLLCLWFHIDILYAYSICDVCDLHICTVCTLRLCFHILDRNKVDLLTNICGMGF